MRKREGSYNCGGSVPIRIDYYQGGGGAGIIFRYKGADTDNQEQVVPNLRLQATFAYSGFVQEHFYFNKMDGRVPNLANRRPNLIRSIGSINYGSTGNTWSNSWTQKDNFAARWTGFIYASKTGNE